MNREMFERQKTLFSCSQQEKIFEKNIVIVGIGALGQMVSETLVRSGFRHLTLIDGDVFTYSNFNRQIYARQDSLGRNKAEITREELLKIDRELNLHVSQQFLTPESDLSMIPEECILVDCTDNISSKLYLEALANQKHLVLVHGAVDGWYGQVASVFPGDRILEKIYQEKDRACQSAIMVTAQVVASLQVRDIIKITIEEAEELHQRIVFVDLLQNEIQTVPIKV